MNIKKAFLIAASACTVALTGCAARSDYYGVFVSDGTYSDITDSVESTMLSSDFDCKETEVSAETVSSDSPSVKISQSEEPNEPAHEAIIETPATSNVTAPPPVLSTTPKTASEPQTVSPLPSSASSKPTAPATAATSASTTSFASSASQTPSADKTQTSAPKPTHTSSTDPIDPAPAPETPVSTKKSETTTATVAAAVDEPAPAEDYINEVLRLVNAERANEGLSPLVLDSSLSKAARVRAEEQVELFGHTRPNGESCFSIFKEYGIKYSTAGENAAAGYSAPEDVVKAWMSSDGHRANILKPCFEKLGVGFVYSEGSYGAYWVQLFVEE